MDYETYPPAPGRDFILIFILHLLWHPISFLLLLQVPLERWRAMSRSCFTAPSVGASAVDYCAVTAAKAKAAALAASGGGGDQGAGAAAGGGAAGGAGGKRGRKAAAAATAAAAAADDLPAVGAALASALLANKETIAPPCVSLDPRNGYVGSGRETKK